MRCRPTVAAMVVILVALVATVPPSRAASLDPTIIGMFPREVSEFSYANLDQARQFSWFAQFKSQALPTRFGELEQFLAGSGIDTNAAIKEVVWALASRKSESANVPQAAPDASQLIGVALGQFNPESTRAVLESRKTPTVQAGDFTLYSCQSCGNLYVVLVDANTIAFGPRQPLERMMEVRAGVADNLQQNVDMTALIDQANDEGFFWCALGPAAARQTIRQTVPQVGDFPQAQNLFAKIDGLVITVSGKDQNDEIETHFHLISSTTQDTSTLSVLFQAGLLLRQHQEADETNPAIAKILDKVRVVPSGNSLDIFMPMSNDQVIALVQHNAFVL